MQFVRQAVLLMIEEALEAEVNEQLGRGYYERGAAMGLWTFAVGCGPFGHLAIGAAAGQWGAVPVQLVFGGVLVAFSLAMLFVPQIRALR